MSSNSFLLITTYTKETGYIVKRLQARRRLSMKSVMYLFSEDSVSGPCVIVSSLSSSNWSILSQSSSSHRVKSLAGEISSSVRSGASPWLFSLRVAEEFILIFDISNRLSASSQLSDTKIRSTHLIYLPRHFKLDGPFKLMTVPC